MSSEKPHFLTIPREIRDQIYPYTISAIEMNICPCLDGMLSHISKGIDAGSNEAHSYRVTRSEAHGCSDYSRVDLAPTPLPYICQQIKEETEDLLQSAWWFKKTIAFCSIACLHTFLLDCSLKDLENLHCITVWSVTAVPPSFQDIGWAEFSELQQSYLSSRCIKL